MLYTQLSCMHTQPHKPTCSHRAAQANTLTRANMYMQVSKLEAAMAAARSEMSAAGLTSREAARKLAAAQASLQERWGRWNAS